MNRLRSLFATPTARERIRSLYLTLAREALAARHYHQASRYARHAAEHCNGYNEEREVAEVWDAADEAYLLLCGSLELDPAHR